MTLTEGELRHCLILPRVLPKYDPLLLLIGGLSPRGAPLGRPGPRGQCLRGTIILLLRG